MEKNLIKNENGATMVELAIVFPILLVVLFAIAELSIALYDKAVLTNASREGARAGIVARAAGERVSDNEIKTVVRLYAEEYLITFGDDQLLDDNIDIDREGYSFGDNLTVSVNYTYDFLVLSRLISALIGDITLNATTVMKME